MSHEKEKTHVRIVVVGPPDSGKSTATGRLLFELGCISDGDFLKLNDEATKHNKPSCLFAFCMDKQNVERELGMTITWESREFSTESYLYTIVDTPGKRDFIKNMINGASRCDVALLTVPATKDEFEASIARGDLQHGVKEGLSSQHARLCFSLGIEQMIVVINKMDTVDWAEDRFNKIKDKVQHMLHRIGYNKKIPFIPMSGWKGDNLTGSDKSDNMPWWNGFSVESPEEKQEDVVCFTLADALEKVVKPPNRAHVDDKPFRMTVSRQYKVQGVCHVMVGCVVQGLLTTKVGVRFIPTGCGGEVVSIETNHKTLKTARCGDDIGVCIAGLPKDNMPRTGDVMVIDDLDMESNLPRAVERFTAVVDVIDHPGKLECGTEKRSKKTGLMEIKGGFTPSIHVSGASAPCQMIAIKWRRTGRKPERIRRPSSLKAGDQAMVVFRPVGKQIYVQARHECEYLSNITVMDSKSLVMYGTVVKVTYAQKFKSVEKEKRSRMWVK